ncbi:MAG: hypothetical protein MUE52_02120 [Tabrizicola sp.]|jgi:hypothetical protein|nr:hypothetical protein [Tabrizicola sp.]
MNPVDEYARLKDDIRRLQDRAEVLRAYFLQPGARLRSNRFEITVRRQKRRVFNKDRLPTGILEDGRYWEERDNEVVLCREISTFRAGDEDIILVE